MRQHPKSAAIYARSATREGYALNPSALEQQVQHCQQYGTEQGYSIAEQHIYQEVASGAEYRNRPGLQALRRAATQHAFEVVIVATYDRFSRNSLHITSLLEELDVFGIQVQCPTESNEAPDTFLHLWHMFLVEQERERLRNTAQGTTFHMHQHPIRHTQDASGVQRLYEQATHAVDLPTLLRTVMWEALPSVPGIQLDNALPLGYTWEAPFAPPSFE